MRRRKPPGQRKAEEYSNEFRSRIWRHSKALSKAIERRSCRRTVKQVFPSQPSAVGYEEADTITTEATPILTPSYHGHYCATGLPLAEHLKRGQRRRLMSAGRHFFRNPYAPEVHRKPFVRFLENMLAGGTGDAVELASLFKGLLDSDGVIDRRWLHRSIWMQAFLRDEPHWEPRLWAWITKTLGPC